jgi:hypothetical protein
MDPLSLLRDFYVRGQIGQVVAREDGKVDFGGRYVFDRHVKTAYASNAGKGEFYDLDSLLYYARSLAGGVKFTDYFKRAREQEKKQVSFIDKKASM